LRSNDFAIVAGTLDGIVGRSVDAFDSDSSGGLTLFVHDVADETVGGDGGEDA